MLDKLWLVKSAMSLRTVNEDEARGIRAVLMKVNMRCMMVVAGLTSTKYVRSGSVLGFCSAESSALGVTFSMASARRNVDLRINGSLDINLPHVLNENLKECLDILWCIS